MGTANSRDQFELDYSVLFCSRRTYERKVRKHLWNWSEKKIDRFVSGGEERCAAYSSPTLTATVTCVGSYDKKLRLNVTCFVRVTVSLTTSQWRRCARSMKAYLAALGFVRSVPNWVQTPRDGSIRLAHSHRLGSTQSERSATLIPLS